MDRKLRNRAVLLLVLAGILAYALVRISGRQPVAKIAATRPVRQNVIASISSNGKIEPISPYTVRAQLDTFVQKVYASEGQNVKKGQLLLELDVKDVAAQLSAAKAKLLKAEDDLRAAESGGRSDQAARFSAELAIAQADRDRYRHNHDALERLIPKGAATKDELAANDLKLATAEADVQRLTAAKAEFTHQAGLDVSSSQLAVQQTRNDIAALEEKVRQGKIIAPIDGTLYNFPVKAGDYVKVGNLLAEMADLHKVQVRAFIDEPEMGGLEPGLPVHITWDALPNRSWLGITDIIPKQVVARNSRSVGELLCSVENNNLDSTNTVHVYWGGVKYTFNESRTDITASYYGLQQNTFRVPPTCTPTNIRASCGGHLNYGSLYVDHHFTKRFDAYAGITYSNVSGGLAIAIPHGPGVPYFHDDNLAPVFGFRFTF